MNYLLASLKNCTDIHTLRLAVQTLCESFGSIARLDIVAASQSGKRQALCFLRMDSEMQELRLMQALGMGRFGGDLVLVVDLQPSAAPLMNAMSSSESPFYQGLKPHHAPHPYRLGNSS